MKACEVASATKVPLSHCPTPPAASVEFTSSVLFPTCTERPAPVAVESLAQYWIEYELPLVRPDTVKVTVLLVEKKVGRRRLLYAAARLL